MAKKFLLIDPSGLTKEIDDPLDSAAREALKLKYIGNVTDFSYVMRDPFIVTAIVHDTGILDGLKMHRYRLLSQLAGPALLSCDTENEWRGFTELESEIVRDALEDSGLMTEYEAEATRPSLEDELF